jgi:hypothetical protein
LIGWRVGSSRRPDDRIIAELVEPLLKEALGPREVEISSFVQWDSDGYAVAADKNQRDIVGLQVPPPDVSCKAEHHVLGVGFRDDLQVSR